MKILILVLFAIVTFSLSTNAQDLSFKTLNQTIEPQGELFSTLNASDGSGVYLKLYLYNEWDKYSVTHWQVHYDPTDKKVTKIYKFKIFYDEVNLKESFVNFENTDDFGASANIKLYIKNSKFTALRTEYNEDDYQESPMSILYLKAKTKAEADSFMEKLKEKAFDMGLDLDLDNVERVSLKEDMYYNTEHPDGITATDLGAENRKKADENLAALKNDSSNSSDGDSTVEKSVSFVTVTLKHTGGERYYLLINGVENADCTSQVFSFTHSKYGEETRTYNFCEGQRLIEKNTGRVIFTAAKAMNGTTYKIN